MEFPALGVSSSGSASSEAEGCWGLWHFPEHCPSPVHFVSPVLYPVLFKLATGSGLVSRMAHILNENIPEVYRLPGLVCCLGNCTL